MDSAFIERFIAETTRAFGFLSDYGFRAALDMVEADSLLVKLPFVGKHVAIVMYYDAKETTVDCYVAKVTDGQIVRDRSAGGYSTSLFGYLVKYAGFRRAVLPPEGESYPDQVTRDINAYAETLRRFGGKLLQDSEDAFDVPQGR